MVDSTAREAFAQASLIVDGSSSQSGIGSSRKFLKLVVSPYARYAILAKFSAFSNSVISNDAFRDVFLYDDDVVNKDPDSMLTTKEPEHTSDVEYPIIEPTISTVEVARVPVAQLRERIGKRKLYDEYFRVLRITPTKAGKFSYITSEEAQLVEEYHLARNTSDAAKLEFLESRGLLDNQFPPSEYANASNFSFNEGYEAPTLPISIDLINLANRLESLNIIARHLVSVVILQGISVAGIFLTREVVLAIVNRKSLPPSKESGKFSWSGFDFTRVNQNLWRVSCQMDVSNATTEAPRSLLSSVSQSSGNVL